MYGWNDVSGSAHKIDITIALSRYKRSRITFHLFFPIVLASFGPLAKLTFRLLRLLFLVVQGWMVPALQKQNRRNKLFMSK
jgi:hypothetical protein